MDPATAQLAVDALARLARFGHARDRATDRELRTITLTDDEALAVLALIDTIAPGGMYHRER